MPNDLNEIAAVIEKHFSQRWEKYSGCNLRVTVSEFGSLRFEQWQQRSSYGLNQSFASHTDEEPSWVPVLTLGVDKICSLVLLREVYGRISHTVLKFDDLKFIENLFK